MNNQDFADISDIEHVDATDFVSNLDFGRGKSPDNTRMLYLSQRLNGEEEHKSQSVFKRLAAYQNYRNSLN